VSEVTVALNDGVHDGLQFVRLVPHVLDRHERMSRSILAWWLLLDVQPCRRIHANDERDDGDQSVRRIFASHVQSQQAISCG